MCKPSRKTWFFLVGVAALLFALTIFTARNWLLGVRLPDGVESELFLSSEPPLGGWHDPAAGADQDEMKRRVGMELAELQERGPISCRLRVIPGAAAAGKPELEVLLTNLSIRLVTLEGHQLLLDYVTFTRRGPEERIVSTFCCADMHSIFDKKPTITIKPGFTETGSLFLSVAAGRSFQKLPPGVYSLEATFHGERFWQLPVPMQNMLARSNRLRFRVDPRKK